MKKASKKAAKKRPTISVALVRTVRNLHKKVAALASVHRVPRAKNQAAKLALSSGRRLNPPRGFSDSQARTELLLYIDNDGQLYRQQRDPIQKNLVRKLIAGKYDRHKSVKLWEYLADNAAKKYTKEFGTGDGFGIFNKATRHEAAEHLASNFFQEYQDGEFSHLVEQLQPKGRKRNPEWKGKVGPALSAAKRELEAKGYRVNIRTSNETFLGPTGPSLRPAITLVVMGRVGSAKHVFAAGEKSDGAMARILTAMARQVQS